MFLWIVKKCVFNLLLFVFNIGVSVVDKFLILYLVCKYFGISFLLVNKLGNEKYLMLKVNSVLKI